jgi:hypothetical protein
VCAAKAAWQQKRFQGKAALHIVGIPGEPEVLDDSEQEIGLIEKSQRDEPRVFGGTLDAGEIDVRRDVALAGLLEPGRRVARRS